MQTAKWDFFKNVKKRNRMVMAYLTKELKEFVVVRSMSGVIRRTSLEPTSFRIIQISPTKFE